MLAYTPGWQCLVPEKIDGMEGKGDSHVKHCVYNLCDGSLLANDWFISSG